MSFSILLSGKTEIVANSAQHKADETIINLNDDWLSTKYAQTHTPTHNQLQLREKEHHSYKIHVNFGMH